MDDDDPPMIAKVLLVALGMALFALLSAAAVQMWWDLISRLRQVSMGG